MSRPKRIFVVAGEHSGDVLGGKLLESAVNIGIGWQDYFCHHNFYHQVE